MLYPNNRHNTTLNINDLYLLLYYVYFYSTLLSQTFQGLVSYKHVVTYKIFLIMSCIMATHNFKC